MYKIRSIKQIIFNKYATNRKITISQRSLRNSSLLLLFFECNNFSFLIDIIDNIIHVSGTRTPTNGSAVVLSSVSVSITWPVFCTAIGGSSGMYTFYTVLRQFLETGTSYRNRSTPENLKFQPIPPFIYPLHSL